MSMRIDFTVPGIPVAKAKKVGMRAGHATAYNDKRTENFQALVTMAASRVWVGSSGQHQRLDTALILRVVAVYPRLACMCKIDKRTGELTGGWSRGRIPKDTKPDFDNLAKSICDGITASGLWTDDARVFDGRVVKFFAAMDEAPHVEVSIREFAE